MIVPNVKIGPGVEVDALLPGRTTHKRVRVIRVEQNGDITVVDWRNGGARTIHPDRIRTVHYKKKLR